MSRQNRLSILDSAFQESFPGILSAKEKKKVRILNHALKYIGKKGVENFNLGTLSRELKMSRSHLQYYYPDIESLLLANVRLITATAQRITVETIAAARDPEEMISASIRGGFEWKRRFPEQMTCMMMFFFYTGFDPKMRQLSDRIRTAGLDRIDSLLAQIETSGRNPESQRRRALQIQSVITGHLISSVIHPSGGKDEEFEEACLETVGQLVNDYRSGSRTIGR